MTALNIKHTHKPVKDYYAALDQFTSLGVTHESAVRSAFQSLLQHCAKQPGWTLVPEHAAKAPGGKQIIIDGSLIDDYHLVHGYWEAKDIHDDLPAEVNGKFAAGYPRDNILFQTPRRAMLYQNGSLALDADLTDPHQLIDTLQIFFGYRPQEYAAWEEAVAQFKERVADIGQGLAKLIRRERGTNQTFTAAFAEFLEKCRQAINPDLSEAAVEEMLIQHMLTERLFRTVFNNPDFVHRNVIASEIDSVIAALTSQSFSRADFLGRLDQFYVAIEQAAATISDFTQKQQFLNTVYEQFFQGFSVEVADTHGIVYTPQPIVDFMVRSVAAILEREFGRSLADEGVHIIDPFVGTGNFIVRIMREIPKTALPHKYDSELHCNEVMLLPYYIASMNIEHEYYDATGSYAPYSGICLVDTFELASEDRPQQLGLDFMSANFARVESQQKQNITVIIGNPPYNMGQANENDNNKNRKYPTMDKRVKDSYVKDSKATLRNKLSDPYVKAVRWASDRIGEEGLVAFVTNNSFLDAVAFDGMRKHLQRDFTKIYHINLKGNARTSGERRRREAGNIFNDQIRVGIGITFLVKKPEVKLDEAEVWIYSVDDYLKAHEKQQVLARLENYADVPTRLASVDEKHTWLTEGLHDEFSGFTPMGSKEAKTTKDESPEVIFKSYSLGVVTARDAWAYNSDKTALESNMERMIGFYNEQMYKWLSQAGQNEEIDDFVDSDSSKIGWTHRLKQNLKKGNSISISRQDIRRSVYRPFTKSHLYFDRTLNERVYRMPSIFPTIETEFENRAICLTAIGTKKSFHCLMSNHIPDYHLTGDSQCFPFYTYDEDGTNRRENITDWALDRFRTHYYDNAITKWDIFHYVYGLLHHPVYRERYQANLKRELPRIPFAPEFQPLRRRRRPPGTHPRPLRRAARTPPDTDRNT